MKSSGLKETIEFVPNAEAKRKIGALMEQGYRWKCLGCGKLSKEKRQERYEDGHGGRFLDMCGCGCDLFTELKNVSCKTVKIEPIDGTLVFKAHHFKYCKCDKGEVWTGSAGTECWMGTTFELLSDQSSQKVYRCSKSGLKIVILPNTKEELENPDEMGSTFLRLPG